MLYLASLCCTFHSFLLLFQSSGSKLFPATKIKSFSQDQSQVRPFTSVTKIEYMMAKNLFTVPENAINV